MVNENIKLIQISGVELLNENEKDKINKILVDNHRKIQNHFKDPIFIEFHLKEYNREGKVKKFSIHVRIHGAAGFFEADYADWDLARTIHKTMNKLLNELEHRFHVSDQNSKVKKPQKERKRI